ncbi:lipopolysaccharide assembly protein LapA domain-containing protein [Paucidesulfovibrio longus]|uniref:lipopolysaccharide assembly protein LapA domain-containing protein n=1 Tax=Paucidesulfovibrio longus TaxID=889 RepID=UPI0003B671C7|nr:lipopolysaccharide assembly protein LapA domain-containing protein [Paucidesulfovibrio longus]
MRYVKLAILALCVAVGVLFFMQNDAQFTAMLNIKLDLYAVKLVGAGIPLYAVVVGAFLLGVLLSLLYFVIEKINSTRQLRSCNKKMRSLEQELTSLRNLPLNDTNYSNGFGTDSLSSQPQEENN